VTRVAFYLGRALQMIAMLWVAYALYTGFVLDDWKGELRLLALGALLFLIGRLVERRHASA
jgi:hypothetical protein